MNTIYPATPTGSVIFCDEIRTEITGKTILIGVYNNAMFYVAPFPIVLPKLAMRITYIETPGESTEPVQIKVLLIQGQEQKVLFTHDIPPAERDKADIPEITEDTRPFLIATFQVELGPMLIQQECRIAVRAYRGDSEYRLGSLFIKHHPQSTAQPAPMEGVAP